MTSILKIVGVVMVVGVLCVGAVAVATDFNWVGAAGPPGDPDIWSDAANWLESGGPPGSGDHPFVDPADSRVCIVDDTNGTVVQSLDVGGSSPTKMKLHVRDGTLGVNDFLVLNDYADLDIDEDLTAAQTHVSGTVWVDIAADKVFHSTPDLWAKSSNAVLNLTTAGTMRVLYTLVDAAFDGAPRGLKIVGGTYTVQSPLGFIIVHSDPAADNRAKFWLASGTIDFECGAIVSFSGGHTYARRVQVDIDQDFDASGGQVSTLFHGLVHVDVASGKTFNASRISVKNTTVLKVTGGGTLVSSPHWDCGCPCDPDLCECP